MYSGLRMLMLEGVCINVEEKLSLEGEIVRYSIFRYSSVSLCPTLGRNEKVEQHIRKKTHKSNNLRFWVEGSVILLYGLTLMSFLLISPMFLPQIIPTSNIRAVDLRLERVQNASTREGRPTNIIS